MKKVLVIDDNPNDRLVIRKILTVQNTNFEVHEASNGELGVELALEINPDLIICDVIMPEIDGYVVLEKLRLNKSTEAIPFIFLTAKNDLADLRKGMNLGADDYLIKPFSPQDLLQAVNTRLKRFSGVKQHYEAQIKPDLDKLNWQLNYDSLTRLPNRFLLHEKFDNIIQKWYRNSQQIIPIITLKLDNLEVITYKHGYDISDLFVKQIAEKLLNFVGQDNTIAHINKDEFVIILTPLNEQNIIRSIVESTTQEVSTPLKIKGTKIKVSPQLKVGISLYPQDGKELDTLLHHSRTALTCVEKNKPEKYQFYSPIIALKNQEELSLENDLENAIDNNQFHTYYQPQIHLKTGKIIGAEVLLRWHHPQLSLVFPNQFIPVAEENGYIIKIGSWLISHICEQIQQIYLREFKNLIVAINLSVEQINQADFNQKLMQNLIKNGITANCLTLEIKENLLLKNDPMVIARLTALHDIGVKIALDDFGTGYSSLSYLQSFPVDVLKIDQCLIRNINDNGKNLTIIHSIIELAHNLNLQVIAEGVETQAELDTLVGLNCDIVQGYFYGEPLPFLDFMKLLRNFS